MATTTTTARKVTPGIGVDCSLAVSVERINTRDEADLVAFQMMETYEADHFRRVIEVGERIG